MKKLKKILKATTSRKGIAAIIIAMCLHHMVSVRSEDSIRSKVVKLTSEHGLCSGEMIKAASGTSYILTAAHCKELAKDGSILVTDDAGRQLPRRILGLDTKSDLMILEGMPGQEGLDIAKHASPKQHVRTFTHGRRFPTYETQGQLIGEASVEFILAPAETPEEVAACVAPNHIEKLHTFFGDLDACIFSAPETATTAKIVPGSSGGPVVDDSGDLVGVVSAGDGDGAFGYLVRLQDIQDFVRNY